MNDALLLKRVFDIISSLLFLLVFGPIIILIGFLNYICSGLPIVFLQERLGKNGIVFKIIKFRTMVIDAVKMGNGIFVDKNDNRITGFGSFLRKTSLDELPQFINVLKGDMSIVGPRPPLPNYPQNYADYPEYIRGRFDMSPGLTGYAQVSGRKMLSWNERFVFDLIYVETYSFHFDIYILLKTIFHIMKREGIYGNH